MDLRLVQAASIAILLSGCSGGGALRGYGPEVLGQGDPSLDPCARVLACGIEGDLFFPAGGNIVRYEPGDNRHERIVRDGCQGVRDLAVTEDGALVVLADRTVSAYIGGYLLEVLTLPCGGRRMSVGDGCLYVACDTLGGGGGALYRYDTGGGGLLLRCEFEGGITAIAGVRGGCLVASGGCVYKVFDSPDKVVSLFVFGLYGRVIGSLAPDPLSRIVYFTADDATYAYLEGQVVQVLPMGGVARFRRGELVVLDHAIPQLVILGDAASRARAQIRAGRE
ncbi:MAG: hypothetical protein HY608_09060 [Planctomycetes bacterium]|nr:hypothetical protein [Planctomycetota bacterium]